MAVVIGKDESVGREVSCFGCGARVRYFRNDVRDYTKSDYDGGTNTYYEICCPGCGKTVSVKPWF
jgi:hypothetical protein